MSRGGLDAVTEPFGYYVPYSSKPTVRIRRRGERGASIPDDRQWQVEEPGDTALDVLKEAWVLGAALVPPVRQYRRAHEFLLESGPGQAFNQGCEGVLRQRTASFVVCSTSLFTACARGVTAHAVPNQK